MHIAIVVSTEMWFIRRIMRIVWTEKKASSEILRDVVYKKDHENSVDREESKFRSLKNDKQCQTHRDVVYKKDHENSVDREESKSRSLKNDKQSRSLKNGKQCQTHRDVVY